MAILETIIEPDANKPKVVQSTSGRPITQPARERVRVYALDGSFQDVWPVDAREIIATNPGVYSFTPFEVVDEQQPEQFVVADDAVATEADAEASPVADSGKDSNRANRGKGRHR